MSGVERSRAMIEANLDGAVEDQVAGEIVRLHLALAAHVALERVLLAFEDEAPNWLGQPAGTVSLGDVRSRHGGWTIPIEWRAASLAPLFPVFSGQLIIDAERIVIDGHYAPPFGVVGYVLDRALLSIAARGTARWFLGKVAGVVGPAGSAPMLPGS
jgi:hypothetical protein